MPLAAYLVTARCWPRCYGALNHGLDAMVPISAARLLVQLVYLLIHLAFGTFTMLVAVVLWHSQVLPWCSGNPPPPARNLGRSNQA